MIHIPAGSCNQTMSVMLQHKLCTRLRWELREVPWVLRSARTSAQSIAYLALSSALPILTVQSVALETYTSLYFLLVPPTFDTAHA